MSENQEAVITEVEPVTEEAPLPEKPVEVVIDLSQVRKEVAETVHSILEAKDLEKDEDGKGVVEGNVDEAYEQEMTKIAEGLKAGDFKQRWSVKIREQWTKVLPKTTKEISAHIRDFVFISYVLKGKQGDTVNIPYATDFDFEVLGSVGAAFADSLGTIYGTTTATLKEAGGWARIPYKDLEKLDANLMDQINQNFGKAAIRAEDKIIMEAIAALTTSQFAGVIDRSTATAEFHAASIPKAIGKLLDAGKEADPGDCVVYLTAAAYGALLSELSDSQPAAFATPGVLRTGRVVDYMGVRIVVGAAHVTSVRTGDNTGTYNCCAFGRYRRGFVLGPKRELLVETEKDTVGRSTKITGSHTLAGKVIDGKEFVRINTSETA